MCTRYVDGLANTVKSVFGVFSIGFVLEKKREFRKSLKILRWIVGQEVSNEFLSLFHRKLNTICIRWERDTQEHIKRISLFRSPLPFPLNFHSVDSFLSLYNGSPSAVLAVAPTPLARLASNSYSSFPPYPGRRHTRAHNQYHHMTSWKQWARETEPAVIGIDDSVRVSGDRSLTCRL